MMQDLLGCTGDHDGLSIGGPSCLACRCVPARLVEGGPLRGKNQLRTTLRPDQVPVPVVIVVVMVLAMSPARDGMRPAEAGAECMRAGAESGDMAPTLRPVLHRSQQVHLQLFAVAGGDGRPRQVVATPRFGRPARMRATTMVRMNPSIPLRWLFRAGAVLLASGLGGAALAADAADPMQQRVAACASCHGAHGEGLPGDVKVPRLAGKPAGYLLQQLEYFQSGQRHHAPMEYVVRQLSPDYLRRIAAYFAAQQVPYRAQPVPALPAAALRRGEQLVRHGDPGRGVPSCESCHGSTLTGVEPMMPGLAGLSYAYIAAQLDAWRTHQRASEGPGCMVVVANRMTGNDVTAVAAWLASQPPPADLRPLPAGAQAEPLPGWCVIGGNGAER